MIAQLRGKILKKLPPKLVIEVGGIGYEVEASLNTFYKLTDAYPETLLYTHLIVREDAHLLYGFHDEQERNLFRALIKVNGVGPKLAITVLSSIDPDAFVRCIADNDTASLVRLPGVGKKTAERLIIEMRDRLADWQPEHSVLISQEAGVKITASNKMIQEAISALVALGYKPQEASRAIAQLPENESLSSQDLIRLALKGIAG